MAHINLDTASLSSASGLGGIGDPLLASIHSQFHRQRQPFPNHKSAALASATTYKEVDLCTFVAGRRQPGHDGVEHGGVAAGAVEAEHPAARLEETLRHCLQQENNILPNTSHPILWKHWDLEYWIKFC